MVYGETGRFPIYVHGRASCIRDWVFITIMDGYIPHNPYKMLLLLHNCCCVSKINGNLYRSGFGFVWENQGVEDVKWFLQVYIERLVDCLKQSWHDQISTSDRFTSSRICKFDILLESYFDFIINKHLRDILIPFRIGAS